jgi:hypothetical protein
MAERNLFSAQTTEWAHVNRRCKRDVNLKTYVNSDENVTIAYQGVIDALESWRVQCFNVTGGVEAGTTIVGRPNQIFPCTYQEWTCNIPFDQYANMNGKKIPVHRPILAPIAKAFRLAVSRAIHAYDAAANVNRTDKVNKRPGEGVNA